MHLCWLRFSTCLLILGSITEGPVTELCFLGIVIDTVAMECRLPLDKLEGLRQEVAEAIRGRKIQLRVLQSLLGKLNFACRIMPMGCVFCRRLAAATAGVQAPHHFIRLGLKLKEDLKVWDSFLATYNGRSLWLESVVSNYDMELFLGMRLVLGVLEPFFRVGGVSGSSRSIGRRAAWYAI